MAATFPARSEIELRCLLVSESNVSAPMRRDMTEIERLDVAARAESLETFLSRAVLPMVFVTVITLLLALGSQASPSETLAVWTFALVGAVTVIMLLRR